MAKVHTIDIQGEQWEIQDLPLTLIVEKLKQQLKDEKYGVPLGVILPYYGTTAPSSNWLICDGSTFDVDQYPALYVFLKSNILPDLREVVLVGTGTNSTLSIADHDVYEVGEFKDDQLQSHTHRVNSTAGLGASGGYQYFVGGSKNSSINTGRSGTTTHGKQVGVNYIIKATSLASDTDE